MRTFTLDPSQLQVETFTTRPASLPWTAFADTDDADCDTESGPPDCETAAEDCMTEYCATEDCSGEEVCGNETPAWEC